MPALRYSKKGKKTYVYIVENKTTIDSETGKKKYERDVLESLGVLNKDVSKSQAKTELYKYQEKTKSKIITITFGEALLEFEKKYKKNVGKYVRQSTFENFCHYKKHMRILYSEKLSCINKKMIDELQEGVSGVLKHESIKKMLSHIRKVLNYSVEKNYIDRLPIIKPIVKTIREKEAPNEVKVLSESDIYKLQNDNLNPELKFYIFVILFSGLRPFEFLNLTWGNVIINKEKPEFSYFKIRNANDKKCDRDLPIHIGLYKLLTEKGNEGGFVCPYKTTSGARTSLRRLCIRLNIPVITPYDLRHTFASKMAENDVSPYKLAKLMGHQKIETTFKYYINIQREKLSESINKHPLYDKSFLN